MKRNSRYSKNPLVEQAYRALERTIRRGLKKLTKALEKLNR
jgi:hypothetical protein